MLSVATTKMLEEMRKRRKNIQARIARRNRTQQQIEKDRAREQKRYAKKKGKEMQCAPPPPSPSAENKTPETTGIKVRQSKKNLWEFQDAGQAEVPNYDCNAMPPKVSGV